MEQSTRGSLLCHRLTLHLQDPREDREIWGRLWEGAVYPPAEASFHILTSATVPANVSPALSSTTLSLPALLELYLSFLFYIRCLFPTFSQRLYHLLFQLSSQYGNICICSGIYRQAWPKPENPKPSCASESPRQCLKTDSPSHLYIYGASQVTLMYSQS